MIISLYASVPLSATEFAPLEQITSAGSFPIQGPAPSAHSQKGDSGSRMAMYLRSAILWAPRVLPLRRGLEKIYYTNNLIFYFRAWRSAVKH